MESPRSAVVLRLQRRSSAGFTLVELLIAIVIIAVLAGIAVFAVGSFRGSASGSACEQDRRMLDQAVTSYQGRHDAPPTNLAQLGPSGDGYIDDPTLSGTSLVRKTYTLTYDAATGAVSNCQSAVAAGSGSGPVVVNPPLANNTAVRLRFTACPSGAVAGLGRNQTFSSTVQVLDGNGAVVADHSSAISVSLVASGGGRQSGPTPAALTVPVQSGVTSGASSVVSTPANNSLTISLTASAPGLTAATCTITK